MTSSIIPSKEEMRLIADRLMAARNHLGGPKLRPETTSKIVQVLRLWCWEDPWQATPSERMRYLIEREHEQLLASCVDFEVAAAAWQAAADYHAEYQITMRQGARSMYDTGPRDRDLSKMRFPKPEET